MKHFRKVSRNSIWAQIFAVLLWFLITVIEWSQNPKASPGILIPVIIRGTEAFAILVVTGIFIWALENVDAGIKKTRFRVVLLCALYPGALIANLISLAVRSAIGYSPPPLDDFFFAQSLHFYLPMLLVMVAYAIVRNQMEVAMERENKLKAENLAQQARWMMLRYQVNPHFLFNALNSIRALIGEDDKNARRIVTELSEYFRYSLTRDNAALVSLEEEIAAVRSYLEIQKIRFSTRLNHWIELDPETLQCAVPVFSIQTLVENGIKYGLKTSKGDLNLRIHASLAEGELHILVANTGKLAAEEIPLKAGESSGTGIENLEERLAYLDPGSRFYLREEGAEVIARLYLTIKAVKNENLEGSDRR
jgi:sensor histidine kinase YesM